MKYWKMLICMVAAVFVVSWTGNTRADEIVIGYTGPLSGPAAEYGQDIFNGVDMAVKELNAAGGIVVKGKKYSFRLDKLDDRVDPTQAVNNARRFRQNKAIAVFNGVFNTIAPMMKINQEKGNEFIVMAYTSTPKVEELDNKLMIDTTVTFTTYVQVFAEWALKKGWKKCAMVVTLGAYGDEWRTGFKEYYQKRGGVITADKPANYYTETDFSSQLAAAIATKPDVMLIGGPSATTALVIEQARSMGYKGGFMLVDQAKQDYIAVLLKGTKIMGDLIGTAGVVSIPFDGAKTFDKKYTSTYKRMVTWECALNYTGMHALAKAIVTAGTVDDVYKIRAAFPKALDPPMMGDKYPNAAYGVTDAGRMLIMASVQTVTRGKSDPSVLYVWWPQTQKEFEKLVVQAAVGGGTNPVYYLKR
ncbi:MAG: ABC transporter substrate-binding protein [Smithellaceae bacterium]|nr:ABC transporter substrate-binding protein [Smithellaceae bacterium]NLX53012.1 ABC transporter substrate-binding protein [Deltaproteobacteria bacterium]